MHRSYHKDCHKYWNTVKQQGLDAREFSIEMDIGSNGGGATTTQFPQKISSEFDSLHQHAAVMLPLYIA